MYKPFAIVDGLHSLFNTYADALGKILYDTSELSADARQAYPNISINTLFYINTDTTDNNIGYTGKYIYSHGELFSNYDNRGGQYIRLRLLNDKLNDTTVFLIGTIRPMYVDTPWSINYHIQQYSDDTDFNSEFDVCVYGINGKVLHYYSQNAIGSKPPFKYHVFKQNDLIHSISNCVQIGLLIGNTSKNHVTDRNISLTITDYNMCKFEFDSSSTTENLDGCVFVNAITNTKLISFTPSGTVSTPLFYGEESTISVSGQVSGTNSESAVTIEGTTVSVNSITSTGSLPSLTYNLEMVVFAVGSLPEFSSVTVWNGYSSATAAAQTFNGATVTLSGTYTPSGTVSAPTFTGDQITIQV